MLRFDRDGLSFGEKQERVHRPHELLEQSFGTTILIYLGVLGGILTTSVFAWRYLEIHPLSSGLILLGIVYLLAAIGWPRSLYLTFRGMRRFSRVDDPLTLRRWMLVVAVLLILAGSFLPRFAQAIGGVR